MKYNDLKIGQWVWDRWFLEWGAGKICKILKTRIHIEFPSKRFYTFPKNPYLRIYDLAHLQFLEKHVRASRSSS